jgi:tetratricopeptide (TPR) repeat protein
MISYKSINNITGWVMFVIAAVVYLVTIEPTASFWDCGEFITSAFKLEVGHPPGAPIFMLVGNLFTQFAGDPSQVAKMVNSMSALMSAFTILFLFWTITHLTRKLILSNNKEQLSLGQTIVVIGSGMVGALVYTFTDTFWFSAVEGEVYAFSSMLTALVFWLILKWEDNAEKPHSDKWLVLIAYIMGLSIGVHLLNLLCIPAIVLVHYFKKNENPTWKGGILALLGSFLLIIVLMWGIIPGFTKVGGWFELFFVNTLGMPYNSGLFVYLILLVASIAWTLFETISGKGKESRARLAFYLSIALAGILFIGDKLLLWIVLLSGGAYLSFKFKKLDIKLINLATTCLFVILVGFSAYALIPIRSSANTPLDLNSPEDIFSLGSYLNREQYGQTPLIYGSTYASKIVRNADGTAVIDGEKTSWKQIVKNSPDQKDRYEKVTSPNYKYTNTMLLPRMHSTPNNPSFGNHIIGYERWGNVNDRNQKPTFWQNLSFMINYQFNYMYWRYFMWNFSGRQNDIQGDGGITAGNWITGIPFFDEHVLGLGPQDNIAPDIVNNKGRNKYYMLPFLLGIIGILYQLRLKEKGKKSFVVVFLLFFMTGLAIILYLNQTPFEPRERDYAYSGSFYAFSIWIGMGVAGLSLFLRDYIKNTTLTGALTTLVCLFVPLQMASQNWDDHDRSGRTLARDTGMNYLCGVGENGILFTNGDNDTYPLWYVQETEGYRTDVRVTNLSFLQTEWYIDQLLRQAYESEPLPIKWSRPRYSGEAGSAAFVITKQEIESVLRENNIPAVSFGTYYDTNAYKDTLSLKETMENLRTGQNSNPKNPFNTGNTQVIPGNLLVLDVDTAKVDWKAIHSKPSTKMIIDLGDKSAVYRQELMILELLSNINDDNWKRPIHFATTISPSLYMNMQNKNFSLNGLSFQVVPGTPLSGGVNIEAAYDNMMNKFRWGGLEENPNIYLDETSRRMLSTFRLYFNQLINALIDAGENEKALAALDKITSIVPDSTVHYGTDGLLYARAYYRLGEREKAEALIATISTRISSNLEWYSRLKPVQISNTLSDIIYNNVNPMLLITNIYQQYNPERYQLITDDLLQYAQAYYKQGVAYVGDLILKEITDNSVRSFYAASQEDTTTRATAEEIMQKALGMMQQFSPRLLEQYKTTQQ